MNTALVTKIKREERSTLKVSGKFTSIVLLLTVCCCCFSWLNVVIVTFPLVADLLAANFHHVSFLLHLRLLFLFLFSLLLYLFLILYGMLLEMSLVIMVNFKKLMIRKLI